MNKETVYCGKWIWNPHTAKTNTYVNFIRDFKIESVSEQAQLMLCADTDYVLWINGSFVSCGQYRDYPRHRCYDTVNIARFLRCGDNRIAIKVYYQGKSSMQYIKNRPGLWFLLKNGEFTVTSNKDVLTCIADEYTGGEIFDTTPQLGYGFECDSRKETDLFAVNEGFLPAEEICDEVFYPRPVEKTLLSKRDNTKIITQGFFRRDEEKETAAQTMQHDYLSYRDFSDVFEGSPTLPGKITAAGKDDIYFVLDFEEERCGYLYFDIDTSCGAVIDISYGEHLDDLRVRAHVGGRNFANRYISRQGKQQFGYYFRRIAGRFMQVHISGFSHLDIYDFGIMCSDYPLSFSGEFESCDSLHNKIFDVCRQTLCCCIHDHYEDTPWREQALYASDSRNQMLCGYYAFSEFSMARSSLALLARGMRRDAHLPICSPTDSQLCIPSFSFIWFAAMKEYILYSNDCTLAEELWDQMVYMINTYTADMKDNLAQRPRGKYYWHFYEWAEGNFFDDPYAAPALQDFEDNYHDGLYNVFLALALDSAVFIGNRLSKNEFCEKYSGVLTALKEGINSHFWNREKQFYCSCTQYGEMKNYSELMQSLAIITGAAQGERADNLRKVLADKNSPLVKITLAYTLYKYEALLMKDDTYIHSVLDEIALNWGKMLFAGTSTFWEVSEGANGFDKAGSLCHGWSAVPLYVYFRYALGITPQFMRGETDETDKYNGFALCRGSVGTLSGKKEVIRVAPIK